MLSVMATDRAKLARDYSLVIISPDRPNRPWGWEIRRKSTPLGVKIRGADFRSENDASIAGEKALKEFIDRLCHEENSTP